MLNTTDPDSVIGWAFTIDVGDCGFKSLLPHTSVVKNEGTEKIPINAHALIHDHPLDKLPDFFDSFW